MTAFQIVSYLWLNNLLLSLCSVAVNYNIVIVQLLHTQRVIFPFILVNYPIRSCLNIVVIVMSVAVLRPVHYGDKVFTTPLSILHLRWVYRYVAMLITLVTL